MKNKNYLYYSLVIVLIFLGGFVWSVNIALAALEFTPNVPIPGLNITSVDGSTLATYIVGLYRYGAGFAGAAAMFMLVFAGWQWLFAAGDASRIGKAKDTINGVLVGLLLLFGGYLLLAQISNRLVSFDNLDLKPVVPQKTDYEACLQASNLANPALVGCGDIIQIDQSQVQVELSPGTMCVYTLCGSLSSEKCMLKNGTGSCPSAISPFEPTPECRCFELSCSSMRADTFDCSVAYGPDADSCSRNVCYGQAGSNGVINTICRPYNRGEGDYRCVPMLNEQYKCKSSADCAYDANQDGQSEYCCAFDSSFDSKICVQKTQSTNCLD